MMRTGQTEVLGEKPTLMPFCPPQIAHLLPLDQNWASASTGCRISTSAKTRPLESRIWWVQ